MTRFLKWFSAIVIVVGVFGFLGFLYFIPPFTLIAPEEIARPAGEAGPHLTAIGDPSERAIAERGRYLVMLGACADCHTTPGPQGPRMSDMYLAGGFKMTRKSDGTYVSVNLTPDKATGIGNWSEEDIKRVLRNGLAPDGRAVPGHLMPWPIFSNWTEEDRHAVVVYLRHVVPVAHRVPLPKHDTTLTDPAAYEEDYAGKDYAADNP